MHHLNSRLRIPLLALIRVGLRRPKRRAAPATTAGRPALAQGLVGIGLAGELQGAAEHSGRHRLNRRVAQRPNNGVPRGRHARDPAAVGDDATRSGPAALLIAAQGRGQQSRGRGRPLGEDE